MAERRSKSTRGPQPSLPHGAPWGNLRSHPAQTKEMLKSPAWADLLADLRDWRGKQVQNLIHGHPDAQELGKIQGVITFIDILSNLSF